MAIATAPPQAGEGEAPAPVRIPGAGADTIVRAFWSNVERVPERPAMRRRSGDAWETLTWHMYGDQVRIVAAALLAFDLHAGDRVAILAGNRVEWHVADLAVLSLGCVTVPLYPTSSPEQVRYVLDHAQARVCFVENEEQLDKVLLVREVLPKLARVVSFEAAGAIDDPLLIDLDGLMAIGRDNLERQAGELHERIAAVRPEDLATLVYTSGTTGPPKGAMVTHGNVMWTVRSAVARLDAREGERLLSFLPLSHIAERMMSDFGAIALTGETWFARSLATVAHDLVDCRPTVFLAVPRVWQKLHAAILEKLGERGAVTRLLASQYMHAGSRMVHAMETGASATPWDRARYAALDRVVGAALRRQLGLDHAHVFVTTAAPIHPDTIRWFHAIGIPVVELYGQTETCGPTTCNPQNANHIGTVGPAIPGVTVRIDDDGEILVKGGNCCAGYHRDSKGTAALLDADGWLHSGDLGALDSDGYLHITGRKKDLIITAGGQNITPQEIEVDLRNHALIAEAVVIGEGRRYLTALITLDDDALRARAQELHLVGEQESLAEDPGMLAEVERIVADVNTRRSRVENIRKYRVIPHGWTVGEGELTPTGKVKRAIIEERYSALIEEMYAEEQQPGQAA